VDQIITACLARMDEAAFSNMYHEGKGMMLDEALEYSFEKS